MKSARREVRELVACCVSVMVFHYCVGWSGRSKDMLRDDARIIADTAHTMGIEMDFLTEELRAELRLRYMPAVVDRLLADFVDAFDVNMGLRLLRA